MEYPLEIQNLPVFSHLDEICKNLKESSSRFLILTAETAAGKSTAVPVALLKNFSGKILMLEPRRLAAVAVAERISVLLGEQPGQTAGYRLHLESKISKDTRLEVITEAILTRKIQSDPELSGINVVVLDEFHERSVHSDFALALLKEVMELRDDLYVVVMSATMNSKTLSEYLNAPVIAVPGRQYEVKIEYEEKKSLINVVSDVLGRIEKHSSVLIFLPGIYEINKVKNDLENHNYIEENCEILILHSSVPVSEQRKILNNQTNGRLFRIILSSSIAETSITVPDVKVVIDSGFSRINITNVSLGMNRLVTVRESKFSADQRAGRAGRVSNGLCIRLWNRNEILKEQTEPEILRTDLTQLVLECLNWGISDLKKLSWLSSPSKSSWNAACNLVELLGFSKNSRITDKGKKALALGIEPRLAAVLLSSPDSKSVETVLKFSEFKTAKIDMQQKFCEDLKRRLGNSFTEKNFKEKSYGELLLEGFPDRFAKRIRSEKDFTEYQFPSGRKSFLKIINGSEYIVAPEVDAGENHGKIYSYEILDNDFAAKWLLDHAETKIETIITDNLMLEKKEILAYGKIILKEKKIQTESSDFAIAICNKVKTDGINYLPLDSYIENFLLRVAFYLQNKKDDNLKNKFDNLQEEVNDWLKPFISDSKITSKVVYDALFFHLNGTDIDRNVPKEIVLKNGKKCKVSYKENDGKIQPEIEIIIQQIFGCFETPQIMNEKILLKLLSPARRPLQITKDLENFWNGAWPEICKEMRGRYPKHNWDYKN